MELDLNDNEVFGRSLRRMAHTKEVAATGEPLKADLGYVFKRCGRSA